MSARPNFSFKPSSAYFPLMNSPSRQNTKTTTRVTMTRSRSQLLLPQKSRGMTRIRNQRRQRRLDVRRGKIGCGYDSRESRAGKVSIVTGTPAAQLNKIKAIHSTMNSTSKGSSRTVGPPERSKSPAAPQSPMANWAPAGRSSGSTCAVPVRGHVTPTCIRETEWGWVARRAAQHRFGCAFFQSITEPGTRVRGKETLSGRGLVRL